MALAPKTKILLDVVEFLARENPNITHLTLCSDKLPPELTVAQGADDLIRTLLRHKENDDLPLVPTRSVTRPRLVEMCDSLPEGRCLALRSRAISSDGEELFFPLVDSCLPVKQTGSEKHAIISSLVQEIHA